jgi:transcriptional regulator with XRE-family HTH domain
MTEHAKEGRGYWPMLILAIRRARKWSQTKFAFEVDTNQETVSRWEQGNVVPSRQKQDQIEHLAELSNNSSLGGISNIVRLSPYPMLLCDGNDHIIAASDASGFVAGCSVISQAPDFQHAYYEAFSAALKSDGFWDASGQSRNYHFRSTTHGDFKAVLVSVSIHGMMFCVVQAIPPSSRV